MAEFGNQGKRERGPRRDMPAEEKQFDERVIHIDRVARVVKGGRRFRFRALVAIGDHKNKVGVGSAKGADVTSAVNKATEVAKKNLTIVPLKDGTISHDVNSKVSGAHIMLKPASPGTGLIAGGAVRTVLEVAGVHNILSKSLGSNNKTNIAYATVAALQMARPTSEWTTRRGGSSDKPKAAKAASKKPSAEQPTKAEAGAK